MNGKRSSPRAGWAVKPFILISLLGSAGVGAGATPLSSSPPPGRLVAIGPHSSPSVSLPGPPQTPNRIPPASGQRRSLDVLRGTSTVAGNDTVILASHQGGTVAEPETAGTGGPQMRQVSLDRFAVPLLFGLIAVFVVFNVLLPLFLVGQIMLADLHKAQDSEKAGSRAQRSWGVYQALLTDFNHVVFVGVAFMIAAFAAYVALRHAYQYNSANGAGATPSGVLNLAEVMFGFFGLVLAVGTAVAGIAALWIKRTVDRLPALEKKFERQVGQARTVSNSNLIISADLALVNLPPLTFSQQIPLKDLCRLRLLENMFDDHDGGGDLWRELLNSQNGIRVQYARNLLQYAKSEPVSLELIEQLESIKLKATGRVKADVTLLLFQAYRRAKKHGAAELAIQGLEAEGGAGVQELVLWGKIVHCLQQGFSSVQNADEEVDPAVHFAKAGKHARELLLRLFKGNQYTWRSDDTAAVPYYCAKGMWAAYFATAARPGREDLQVFNMVCGEAFRQLMQQQAEIDDALARSIYLASTVYLVAAWREINGEAAAACVREHSSGDELGPWMQKTIDTAKQLFDVGLDASSLELGTHVPVYSDFLDVLALPPAYAEYLRELGGYQAGNDARLLARYKRQQPAEALPVQADPPPPTGPAAPPTPPEVLPPTGK